VVYYEMQKYFWMSTLLGYSSRYLFPIGLVDVMIMGVKDNLNVMLDCEIVYMK